MSQFQTFIHTRSLFCILNHVKEAGSSLLLREAALPEEILLGMAGHLRRCSCRDEVPGNAAPVAFPELLEPYQEFPVLLFSPWNT